MNQIQIVEKSGSIEITVTGELNIHNSGLLLNKFIEQMQKAPAMIGINCENLDSIDSSGLGALINMSKHSNPEKTQFYICELNKKVSSLFDISNLDSYFSIMSIAEFRKLSDL